MTSPAKMRVHLLGAALTGMTLRLLFICKFPFADSGDSPLYTQLARNWLDHGVYGLYVNGALVPTDLRAPGYPAFLASVYAMFGRSVFAVMLSQVATDLVACFLIAALAAWVAPEEYRRRVGLAALWLAALCPFTANYTATLLSEVLAVFFTALALMILLFPGALVDLPGHDSFFKVNEVGFLGGFAAGLGALVRPETPLLLMAVALVLLWRCRKPVHWRTAARAGMWMALGLFLALLPWGARNWRTLHKAQFLAPRYGDMRGEFVPHGFYAWTRSWLWRTRDLYRVTWKLDDEIIRAEDAPPSAFDSPEEQRRVAELLQRYNQTTTISASVDDGFAEIARERTARHPLRLYVTVPVLRAAAMWFTPRVELLPYSGHLWPLREQWQDDPVDFSVTAGLGLLHCLYVGLAIAGAWIARRQPATAFLVVFLLVRTAFFSQIETPEPRYLLECFPALLALAAQVWTRRSATLLPQ
jgi:4-amino-4-deoxy-L-arabinose transferase-like glycosyltransferase